MKKVKYPITILNMIVLVAFFNGNKGNSSDAIAGTAKTSRTEALASFSAIIDGLKVTGNGIDEIQ